MDQRPIVDRRSQGEGGPAAPGGHEREADALLWIVHGGRRALVALNSCQLLVADYANFHALSQSRRLIYLSVLARR